MFSTPLAVLTLSLVWLTIVLGQSSMGVTLVSDHDVLPATRSKLGFSGSRSNTSSNLHYHAEEITASPTAEPTELPSTIPTEAPSAAPTAAPSMSPSPDPSSNPTASPTQQPSSQPTSRPSCQPSSLPTMIPTSQPTSQPSNPTSRPSSRPSAQPLSDPSTQPSSLPSSQPTRHPSAQPSSVPSTQPSSMPSVIPSAQPSSRPSSQPIGVPSAQPTDVPSSQPTSRPSTQPSSVPSTQPSSMPSARPTTRPSSAPSGQPSSLPSTQPSSIPSVQPSALPTSQPSAVPSMQPNAHPSSLPSSQPTAQPSSQPSAVPSGEPSSQPSTQPSRAPTAQPTTQPSGEPTSQPSGHPTVQPTSNPTQPTSTPSAQPSTQPTGHPSTRPSVQPSSMPSLQPFARPTSQPSRQPSSHPSCQPTSEPSAIPTMLPSCGVGALGYNVTCSPCPAGTYLDDVYATTCTPCPKNTFARHEHSSTCDKCPYPYQTVNEGSAICDAVNMEFDWKQLTIMFGSLGILFLFCLFQAKKATFAAFSMMVMPTLDVMTDLAFIVTTKFNTQVVFYCCIFFYVISNVAFLYRLYSKGYWYRCFYMSFYDWRDLLFLRITADGRPARGKQSFTVPAFVTGPILRFCLYGLLWVIMISLQIAAPLLYVGYMFCHFGFILFWLFVGFFVFQTKVLAIKEVDNFWLLVWTGEIIETEVGQAVDMDILNQSIFFEFLLETLPQIVIQIYVQSNSDKGFTPIGIFSQCMSFFIMFNGVYRFGYYKFYWGLSWKQIPPSSDFMPDPNAFKPESAEGVELGTKVTLTDPARVEDILWRFLFTHQPDLRVPSILIIKKIRTPDDLRTMSDRTVAILRKAVRGEGNVELFDRIIAQLKREAPRTYLRAAADWITCRRRRGQPGPGEPPRSAPSLQLGDPVADDSAGADVIFEENPAAQEPARLSVVTAEDQVTAEMPTDGGEI